MRRTIKDALFALGCLCALAAAGFLALSAATTGLDQGPDASSASSLGPLAIGLFVAAIVMLVASVRIKDAAK